MIPKNRLQYVYRDAELFGCLTKEKIIGKIYFTLTGWQVEDSHMHLGVVFQFASPRCNVQHLQFAHDFFS